MAFVLYLNNWPCFHRYCIPMDSTRPILPAELEFFNKGTGKGNLVSSGTIPINNTFTVPLVVVFTKFDGQIIQESGKLGDMDDAVKWDKARENAEITFQKVYLPKVFETNYPPKAYVCLEGGDYWFCNKLEMPITLSQIWTCQRITVLNWLNKQLMPLMMPVYENCLSPLKWTTSIFVVEMELSEYHIKMSISKCWQSQDMS